MHPSRDAIRPVCCLFIRERFNPRIHFGCDFFKIWWRFASGASTHASLRGCDRLHRRHPSVMRASIHAPTRMQFGQKINNIARALLQPAHPWDAIEKEILWRIPVRRFNPRTHKSANIPLQPSQCFNPRIPHGMRLSVSSEGLVTTCFNPRIP